eukprot:GHVO01066380.1.p1 GENE.GHVO01066380.1~~GHVO01066380.1.p1  ORF type:complete len:169 (-),score=14.10 GHVO01066380.1:52-558(-)
MRFVQMTSIQTCAINSKRISGLTVTPPTIVPHNLEGCERFPVGCDACPNCDDVCNSSECKTCAVKSMTDSNTWYSKLRSMIVHGGWRDISTCTVSRHSNAQSCWIVANGSVYDVTDYLPRHIAGSEPILRKSGGDDCTEDYYYHTHQARTVWKQYKIGVVKQCDGFRK